MVHLDYECLPSNRVYESRDNKNLYIDRLIKVQGNYLSIGIFIGSLIGSYAIFLRSFKDLSLFNNNNINRAVKYLLPAYLGFVYAKFIRYGCILHLGDPIETIYLSKQGVKNQMLLTDLRDNVSIKNYKIIQESKKAENYLDDPNLLNKLI